MKLELRDNDLSVVRDEGLVPGVIYGHEIEPTKIKVNYKELKKTIAEKGSTVSFETYLDGKPHTVFFKEVQRDSINQNDILHFDLMKVTSTDLMTAAIPIHLKGRDAIDKKGLVVQLLSNTLEYEFPVNKGISSIDVDIASLEAEDSVLASAIDIPEGFVLQEDPNKIVLNITHPTIETEIDDDDEQDKAVDTAVEEDKKTK